MTRSTAHIALIATWTHDQNITTDPPTTVRWSDGRSASVTDYTTHSLDTHVFVDGPAGIELRMFPDITAEVHYDQAVGSWILTGDGVETTSLELDDPQAKDEQIIAETFTLPMVYRTSIRR
jgi:hypothetical protein